MKQILTATVIIIFINFSYAQKQVAPVKSTKPAPIALRYQKINDFSEGYAAFLAPNDKWGFINTSGKVVLPPMYNSNSDECFIKFGFINPQQEGKIIDSTGNVILEAGQSSVYRIVKDFTDANFTTVCTWSDGAKDIPSKRFLVNKKGEVVRELSKDKGYVSDDCTQEIHDGRIWIKDKNNKYGFLNLKNELVIPTVYNDAYNFSNNRAWVQRLTDEGELKWGAIDTNGVVKVPFIYSNPQKNFSNNRCFIEKKDGGFILIDENGNSLSNDVYNDYSPYKEDYTIAVITKDWKKYYQILSYAGKVIKTFVPPANSSEDQIELVSGIKEGVCIARKGELLGVVDVTGKILIPFEFTQLHPFYDGRAFAQKTDKTTNKEIEGFIDHKGNFVIIKKEESDL